jgi:hypothetical protein
VEPREARSAPPLEARAKGLSRCHDARPSLRLQLDDDVLEVSKATDEQVAEAFEIFVQRHSTAGAPP